MLAFSSNDSDLIDTSKGKINCNFLSLQIDVGKRVPETKKMSAERVSAVAMTKDQHTQKEV